MIHFVDQLNVFGGLIFMYSSVGEFVCSCQLFLKEISYKNKNRLYGRSYLLFLTKT